VPTWRLNNSTVLGDFVCGQWTTGRAYKLGDRVVCRTSYATVARRAWVYECTTAGTSHAATEPVWPASGTVADGATLVWTTRSPNDGDWNNATCILHYIMNHATMAAGDTIYVDDGHSEIVNLGVVYIILGGTQAAPIRILCVDKASDVLSTGAIVYNTNANGIRLRNFTYSYGITYTSSANIIGYDGSHIFEGNGTTVLKFVGGGYLTTSAGIKIFVVNGNINFDNATSKLLLNGPFSWKKGALTGTAPNKLFDYFNYDITLECVDLSNLGNNDLVNVAGSGYGIIILTRCKLPATFDYIVGAWLYNTSGFKLHQCSNSNIIYDFYEANMFGILSQNIAIYATGGANNGVTPFSMKMVSASSSFVKDGIIAFESLAINGWTNSVTEKTFTIEGIYDSVTNLQNDEVWAELQYPNNSSGLGLLVNTKCTILTAPADLTVSTKAWTSTGITNVNKFKFTFTVTPGKAGPIMARIYLAKAATTIYIDPMIVES
jgi:hypothetical protein